MSQLAAEERRLGEERRSIVAERERRVSEGLSDTLADVERRLDERLQGVADDLDRAERHLETQLARLTQRQQQAIAEVEARIEREAAELGTTSDEQRRAVRAAPRGARAGGGLCRDRGARRARGAHDRAPPIGGGDHRAPADPGGGDRRGHRAGRDGCARPARADADRVRAAPDRAARARHGARDRAPRAAGRDGVRRADARDSRGGGDEALPRARPCGRDADARGARPAAGRGRKRCSTNQSRKGSS